MAEDLAPQTVQVLDPDQNLVSIPKEQLNSALDQGYIEPTQQDLLYQTHGGAGQQALAGLEGAAESATFGLSTKAETATGLTTPEDIRSRRELYPGTHMAGQVAGLLAPTGAAGALEKAGAGAAKLAGLGAAETIGGKVAESAVKGFVETALLQSGDEVSKMFTNDPTQSVGTAAANIGLSGILGGGIGGGLGAVNPLWKATAGDRMGQFLEDFKTRMKSNVANPDPASHLGDELGNYYKNITGMADEVYGPKGLKAQEIEKLTPPLNEKILNSSQELASKLEKNIAEMRANPEAYPERLVNQYERQANRISEAVTNPQATSGSIFDAVQTTKQWAQDFSKDARRISKFEPEYEFAQKTIDLSKELRPMLEDADIWGKAGTRQQSINKAFTEYLPALKDFEKKFTAEIGGDRVIDPTKVSSYLNQLGKPNAELKQEMLGNFLKASEKYRGTIADTHRNLGIENPFEHASTAAAQATLEKLTPGAKAADYLYKKGLANLAGESIAAAIGAGVGSMVGHGGFGAIISQKALGPVLSRLLPALAKPFTENPVFADAAKAAIDYGTTVLKGEAAISRATKSIFKSGETVLPTKMYPTQKEKEKLDKQLKTAQSDPSVLMNVGGTTGHYMPDHQTVMAQTAMTAVNYLNSLRPNVDKKGPLDSEIEPNPAQKAVFDRALDIAEQPLVVLDSIKEGTLTPQDVKSLSTMYPGLYGRLVDKINNDMVEHVSKENPISYKTRLGLSLFLGQPLDSTMTPQSIIAAQPKPQQAPQMGGMHAKHSTEQLSKLPGSYATPNQARQASRTKLA